MVMEKFTDVKNGMIDISNHEELKQWTEILCCKEKDLVEAVMVIGNSAKMVDSFLYLNRKKNSNDK